MANDFFSDITKITNVFFENKNLAIEKYNYFILKTTYIDFLLNLYINNIIYKIYILCRVIIITIFHGSVFYNERKIKIKKNNFFKITVINK